MQNPKKRLVVGNWKMNTTREEAEDLAHDLKDIQVELDVVLCPPFPWLLPLSDELKNSDVALGAQNAWEGSAGAFTGEVSVGMLAPYVGYIIVGHSERRRIIGETSELVNRKVKSILEKNLTPILCVGEFEKLDDKEPEENETVNIFLQLKNSLKDLSRDEIEKVVIAYEPVWAIGTGDAATPEYAEDMINKLRDTVRELAGHDIADKMRILYGGSVNAENAESYAQVETIDGALVGGASLNTDEFKKIISAFAE